jgi:hypothetical protein
MRTFVMPPTSSITSEKLKTQGEDDFIEDVEANIPESQIAGPSKHKGDEALEILGDSANLHEVTPEEDKRILRKIDLWLMPVILLVYFLQQLDKCV